MWRTVNKTRKFSPGAAQGAWSENFSQLQSDCAAVFFVLLPKNDCCSQTAMWAVHEAAAKKSPSDILETKSVYEKKRG
jgi:hypothetical protein